MISKFTNALLEILREKTSQEKLETLRFEFKSTNDSVHKREIHIAIRMLEENKFLYQTDGFSDDEIMNKVHKEIFEKLNINKNV